jgi:hypothetical protein
MSDIPGWFSDNDAKAIEKIAEQLPKTGVLVELGSFFGRSGSIWAEIFRKQGKNYKIYCVDTYEYVPIMITKILDFVPRGKMQGNMDLLQDFMNGDISHFDIAQRFLSKYPEITMVRQDIYSNPPFVEQVDCVFEDANHSKETYDHVVNKWYPLLTENGIFCGHDYSNISLFAELKGAIDNFAETNDLKLILYPGSVVYNYQRKNV